MFSDTTKLITAIKDYIPEENWIEVIKNINFENLDDDNILNILLKYCPIKDIEDFLYYSEFELDDISEAANLLNHNVDIINNEDYNYSLEEFLDNIDELDDTGIQNLVKYLTTVDLTDTNEFDEDIMLQILQSDLVKFSSACYFDDDFTYFGYEGDDDIVTSNSKLSPDVVKNLIMSFGKSKHYYYFNNIDIYYNCDRPIFIADYYGDILKHFDVYVSNGGGQMSCYIKEDFLDLLTNSRRNEIKNYIIRNLGYTDEEIESEDKPLNLTWEEMHKIINDCFIERL